MRILITGSRDHRNKDLIREAIQKHATGHDTTIVTGNCPTGADRLAESIARAEGYSLELHPANWNLHGRAAGPIRNQHMVDLGADVVLAFPVGESRGTMNCVRAALRAGLRVEVHKDLTDVRKIVNTTDITETDKKLVGEPHLIKETEQ